MSEAQVIRELKEAFDRVYGGGDCRIFFAPGRVNLIGEHIGPEAPLLLGQLPGSGGDRIFSGRSYL